MPAAAFGVPAPVDLLWSAVISCRKRASGQAAPRPSSRHSCAGSTVSTLPSARWARILAMMASTGKHPHGGTPNIPGYQIGAVLGRGGMGVVYRAQQHRLHRTVAIKVMRADLDDEGASLQRFLREADAVARISHPNVIPIYDIGNIDGLFYMVFPYIDGGDIVDWLDKHGAMPEAKALQVLCGCLEGVQAILEAGLIHRDIKPGNIFYDGKRPVIGDFGLVRVAKKGSEGLTRDGSGIGTPAYMAPEQIRDAAKVDIRADLYALGASLYTMVTDEVPYSGESPYAITHLVLSADPPPDPRRVVAGLSDPMVAIIRTAMCKDLRLRYQSPAAMRQDVDAALHGRPLVHAAGGSGQLRDLPVENISVPVSVGEIAGRGHGAWSLPILSKRMVTIIVLVLLAIYLHSLSGMLDMNLERFNPPWANSDQAHRDALGHWTRLQVGTHNLRFRYIRIPPADSRVLLGSASDEIGFRPHESQRVAQLIDDYWLAEVEVSQGLWQEVMDDNPSRHQDPDKPVDSVGFDEVQIFLQRLNKRIPGLEARLPTEDEWEYACRAGSKQAFGQAATAGDPSWQEVAVMAPPELVTAWSAWQNGEQSEDAVWEVVESSDSGIGPRAVRGSRPANAFGLYDMHGNVAEWCRGDFAPSDPRGVVRGGSWWHPPRRCRAAARQAQDRSLGDERTGFRIAVPITRPTS